MWDDPPGSNVKDSNDAGIWANRTLLTGFIVVLRKCWAAWIDK